MENHLPIGRLAERLHSTSREMIWLAVLLITSVIALIDFRAPAVGLVSLYVPVICGASWALGGRAGYLVAVLLAILAIVPGLDEKSFLSPGLLVTRVGVHVLSYLVVAAAITSFRRSYVRELYHAHRDRMTGALNKQVFHVRSAEAIDSAARAGTYLLLAIIDLDDFKGVNSREGHAAGDDVLRIFAEGAASIIRREDLIGRIGGDEFALLVRIPSISDGHDFARDVHVRLTSVLAVSRDPVTCSMGALLIPPGVPHTPAELMHVADQIMYKAKHMGKNAIEIAVLADVLPAPVCWTC